MRCRDSNSRPLEHESPSITTRPGLLSVYLLSSDKMSFYLIFFHNFVGQQNVHTREKIQFRHRNFQKHVPSSPELTASGTNKIKLILC